MLFSILFVILLIPEMLNAHVGSRLLVFNTLVDLLRGDIWESITQKDISRYFYVYPENFEILGIGTTNRAYRMGEVMLWGPVNSTTFYWANPEYPYQMSEVQDVQFPWIQVALFDPQKGLSLNLKATKDLHGTIMERMRLEGIRISAIQIEAITVRVEYSLTNHIPKTGLDMTGSQGRSPYFQAFQDERAARWIFFGIYVDEEMTASCGIVPGQPLLLMGYNPETRNGGLIRSAQIKSARIQYHPIENCQVIQSDLLVSDVRIHENRISIDVLNAGELTAGHVRVRLTLPDSEREMDAILSALRPQEDKTVRFRLIKSPSDKTVIVEVDPENDILEAEEGNNRYEKKRPFWGW
jgi:hypothetical protein